MKALVAGATGGTGRRIVAQLVDRGIPVRALVRNAQLAREILPAAAEIAVGDVLKPETLTAAIADCTVVLCATGARPDLNPAGPFLVDYVGTNNLIGCAKQHQIQHFVLVTSLCVSRLFHPLNLFWLVLFWKRQAEKHLQASGLTYTIVRPGGLRHEDTPGGLYLTGADRQFQGSIPRGRVAGVCIDALFQLAAANKIVEIVTQGDRPDLPIAELFASL